MNKFSIITLVLLLLTVAGVQPVIAGNPFTSGKSPERISESPMPPHPLLAKIALWQQTLNQKMSGLIRQVKETGSLRPLMTLILIAFGYGLLHAAGPGHGKAVAASYILSGRVSLGNGVLFGNMVAFFHGLSGILLVLGLRFIIRRSVMGTLADVSLIGQRISYGLIFLVGLFLFFKSLRTWFRPASPRQETAERNNTSAGAKGPVAMALAVGMVPCPGVVLVMLFSLSLNMPGLGILLAACLTLGMAVTISAVTVIGLAGKNVALNVLEGRGRFAEMAENLFETIAALMVTLLGLLFLLAI